MRKTLLYISLISLGLAVELALLESGKGIVAPPAVGGEWQMQVEGECAELRSPVMTIDQTGPRLEILISGMQKLNGSIARNRIAAAGAAPVRLSATSTGPSLRGRIQCRRGAVSFTAERRRHE